jgi:hypothetical protein
LHALYGGLATQRAPSAVAKRPTTKVHHVNFAVLRLDEIRVPGSMEFGVGPIARSENVNIGMKFIRPG